MVELAVMMVTDQCLYKDQSAVWWDVSFMFCVIFPVLTHQSGLSLCYTMFSVPGGYVFYVGWGPTWLLQLAIFQ